MIKHKFDDKNSEFWSQSDMVWTVGISKRSLMKYITWCYLLILLLGVEIVSFSLKWL